MAVIEKGQTQFPSGRDALFIKATNAAGENINFVLGSFHTFDEALVQFQKLKEKSQEKAAIDPNISTSSPPSVVPRAVPGTETEVVSVPSGSDKPVAPDPVMPRMYSPLKRMIKNISVQRYYEIVWSEGQDTNEKPLYGPWIAKACFDIEFGKWEFNDFVGPWCGEKYTQRRVVRFKVKRTRHLYIGPPIANVVQTHYCRIEGNDRCVTKISIFFEGMPYCDYFTVEQRWVATRQGSNDLLVQAGVAVDFKKYTVLKDKILAGTKEENGPIFNNFFGVIKEACVAAGGGSAETDKAGTQGEDVAKEERELVVADEPQRQMHSKDENLITVDKRLVYVAAGTGLVLAVLWMIVGPSSSRSADAALLQRLDQLESDVKEMKSTLDTIVEILKKERR